jgi:hypothetical protein
MKWHQRKRNLIVKVGMTVGACGTRERDINAYTALVEVL